MVNKSVGLVSSILASVDPSDLGSAAYKDTGTNAGQIPILDSNGKLSTSTIPAVAITDVFTASSQQEMLALSAEKGDVCIRSDEDKTYLLMDSPASTLSNWVQISNTSSVVSVNNKSGVVTLDADDVGAVSKNTAITGSTKCKITYDSKGLVTSGADLQVSDIPDLSSNYVASNTAITGNTKCKITYDNKGLVTAGADLQASDIPDLSSSYVTNNSAITGATKCKITYDSKGLVTAGADLQASDIPDISLNYVATNTAITGATKCKITYDSKGLVTAGDDLQASDIPDLSSSYVTTNTAITGNTKCKITYDSKGLVTSGADLSSTDIPDLSSSYVTTNTAITGATKCKITYDSKGLVTSGADLDASDLPSHTHSASDITSGELSVVRGGTGANTVLGAVSNLKLTDTTEQDFSANNESAYLQAVQNYFENNNTTYVPLVFNAGWAGQGYGVAFGAKTHNAGANRTLAIFNEKVGFKLYHKNGNNAWLDYSPNGTTLYWNQSGSSSTITLSENANNFQRLRIYYKDSDGFKEAKDVNKPLNGVTISLSVVKMLGSNNALYTVAQKITISGTSLTFASSDGGYVKHTSSGNTMNFGTGRILVVRVIGYKY